MNTVTSRDGTRIAYDKRGTGPALILVDGAFCHRGFGPMPKLAEVLSDKYTVYNYDRRGRGDSADTKPYSVEKEIEDLTAIFDAAGGSAFLYGVSSGAALALRAAGSGLAVRKLALYEPPFALDGYHTPRPADFREQIAGMVRNNQRDDAVKLFMRVVGVPAFGIFMMRMMRGVWKKLVNVAHTLLYDFAVLGDTQRGGTLPDDLRALAGSISVRTLAMSGSKSPEWMRHAADVVASVVQNGSTRVLPGQTHNVSAKAVEPALREFFV